METVYIINDPILKELQDVKDRFSEQASGVAQFGKDMDAWLEHHPHLGPVVNSPEELEERLRRREAAEQMRVVQ